MQKPDILILGVGNALMGDEGVGVEAVRVLQDRGVPDGVEAVDGGTGGFHLLSYFSDYPRIVMIDATLDAHPPGTVRVLRPRFAHDFPRSLSAHDIGLRDLLEAASLLHDLPEITLVVVSVKEIRLVRTGLSTAVREALPAVIEAVERQIAAWRAGG